MIDQLLAYKNSLVKKLEFRNRFETFYLEEEELLYAVPDDRTMRLTLTNGEEHVAEMTAETFCGNLNDCDSYIELVSHTVLNMRYVRDINFFRVTMRTGNSSASLSGNPALSRRRWKPGGRNTEEPGRWADSLPSRLLFFVLFSPPFVKA